MNRQIIVNHAAISEITQVAMIYNYKRGLQI